MLGKFRELSFGCILLLALTMFSGNANASCFSFSNVSQGLEIEKVSELWPYPTVHHAYHDEAGERGYKTTTSGTDYTEYNGDGEDDYDDGETPDYPPIQPPPGSSLVNPTNGVGCISSYYGMRWHPTKHVYKLHTGIDIALAGGLPVYAAEAGYVMSAGYNDCYGNYVSISHYNGTLRSGYGHLSAIYVSEGQWVEKGQVIGAVGTTGCSTGNHLHFELFTDGVTGSDGYSLDPLSYISVPGC